MTVPGQISETDVTNNPAGSTHPEMRLGRRSITIFALVVPMVAFFWIGMSVSVPYVSLGPGPTVNTLGKYKKNDVITLQGEAADPVSGNFNLTTVSVTDELSLFQALGKWFSHRDQIVPRAVYFPPKKSKEEVNAENKAAMIGSENAAEVAALSYLKRPLQLVVTAVAEKGPAAGQLKENDVIVAINGVKVVNPETLRGELAKHTPNDSVTILVLRNNREETKTVVLGKSSDDDKRPVIGISMMEQNANPKLKITINLDEIGGPSAGLMLTLALIDKLSPGPLNFGKFIAGTGTISGADGRVGPIGGIEHKMVAAKEAGAQAFLVPADNCDDVVDPPSGMTLIKVSSVTEAIVGIKAFAEGAPVPQCSKR